MPILWNYRRGINEGKKATKDPQYPPELEWELFLEMYVPLELSIISVSHDWLTTVSPADLTG